jgi:hypothetical protein
VLGERDPEKQRGGDTGQDIHVDVCVLGFQPTAGSSWLVLLPQRRMSSSKPKRRPPRADWIGRRWRREGEWSTRLHRLHNRLIRYMATARPADDTEYRRLEIVEARMADIVFAAGAIETSYLRIYRTTSALAGTPMWRPGKVAGLFEMDTEVALSDRARKLFAALPDAYYDFHSMLWAGRSLLFRVDGNWGGDRIKGERSGGHLTGLVHYLPRREAARIHAARDRLVKGAFADVRHLADYSLHAFAVPGPTTRMNLQDDGTWALPLPDRLGRQPKVGEQFTFNEGRHVGSEADALWIGVQQFIADLFEALEKAQLRREEALSGDALKLMRHLREDLMPPITKAPALRRP